MHYSSSEEKKLLVSTPKTPFKRPNLTFYIAASDVETLLKSVGIEPEKERIATLVKALEGKKLHELISAGSTKLSTLSGKFVPNCEHYLLAEISHY